MKFARLHLACSLCLLFSTHHGFLFAQQAQNNQHTINTLPQEKAVVCQTNGQNLCISPANDIVMSLQGCASGSEFGFPTFEINVPSGQDLIFNLTKNPVAIHDSFFLVNQAVANTPPALLDICIEQNPGIYTPPLEITPFDAASIPFHTIPSAVVDQMADESALNGFVVMIARDCQGNVEAFAGVRFTRNPASIAPLTLTLVEGPLIVEASTFAEYTFEIENSSKGNIQDLVFEFNTSFGLISIDTITHDGMIPTQVSSLPYQKTFSLGPNQSTEFTVRLFPFGPGFHGFYGQVLSELCIENGREDVFINVIPLTSRANKMGKGRVGDDIETEVTVTNPGNEPLAGDLTATEENGRAMSLEDMSNRVGFQGNSSSFQLGPGQTQTFRFSRAGSGVNRFMVHVSSDLPLLAAIRQHRRIDTRAGARSSGSSAAMRDYNQATQTSGRGVIPYKIVAAENKKIVVDNYNMEVRVLTINIRDVEGGLLRSFTGVIANSLAILTFPLVAGLDENAYIEIDGGPGIFAELEQCSANDFNLFKMTPKPQAAPRSEPERFAGSPLFAQPFSQVAFPSISYGPSTYDMFVFPLNNQGIAANSVAFEFDEGCGVNPAANYVLLTSAASANATLPITLNNNSNLRGGFAFFDDSDTTTSFRWIEGGQTFFMQAVTPVTKGRIFTPDVLLEGQITPSISPMRFQVYTDEAMVLSTASFASDGSLLSLKNIALTPGGHQLCNADLGLVTGTAFIEIQAPEDHPVPFWFNALADEATLDYKDQLPLIPIEGETIITQIGNVLAAWGDGPSCLGDMPDMIDLVGFVNNNFMCPATP